MGAQPWPVVVLFVVLAVVNTEAGSCRPAGCSKSGGNGLFKYTPGHTYVYKLEGVSLTDLPEQQGDGVKVELSAVAEVHFGADCTSTLSLKDVSVTGPTAKKYGNLKELEAHPVRFSFDDGRVDAELCADDADTNTALNIKRAVISLLQVGTPQSSGSASKHETDLFGSCPTNFAFEKKGGQTQVTKSRNLNKCSHREDLRQRVLSTPYITDSQLQSSPLLDSSLVVEQNVKAGVLQSAESREIYVYRPFANKEAGAKTVVTTKLTLASESAGTPHTVNGGTARSLIFDAPHGDGTKNSNSASIVAALHDAKTSMPDLAGATAATEFRHLVEVFRHSSKVDLLTVYGQVKAGAGFPDKVAARKVYLDALLHAGTGDSVQVAVELLSSNELTGDVTKLWYASMGFVRHATVSALAAAASLLDNPAAPKAAYLGVGSLAGQYCQEHDCDQSKPVADLLAKLAKPIAGGCKCGSHDEENKMIAALKGIENVRRVDEPTAELLRVCASDLDVPARVRVSALETFRVGACQPQLKKSALEILSNRNEDSEIRIKAYLAAVTCPCGKCANTLKELLDSEPVNQVGSFIVSHLRNMRASNNPDKALAKRHLSEVRASRRFPEDVRRYSNNREFSYFLDAVNVGSAVERNVIYSQQSYLPRSTSLNITTEIFGHSFNLLEIGTRAENLDRIVEAYFGPKGYFKSHDLKELFANGKATFKGIKEKLQERAKQSFPRSKRSVPQDKLEAFRKQIALSNDRQSIDLDLNIKLFGSNVGGLDYHGNAIALSPESIFDKIFDRLDNCLEKAKSFEHDIKRHGVFLETELAYPTGLGFPLKLAVAGSAAVHLKTSGKIDIHTIIKDPKNAHVQFEFVPSAAVEVIGEMTIDAYAFEAGLKATAILHTSTGVNVDIKTVDGTGFDVNVGLPVKKNEIVNFKSELLTSVQERGQAPVETPLAFNVKRKDYHGCFDQLSSLVGLTFCGDLGVPFDGVASKAAFFPLNGPSRLSLSVESDDVASYRFRGVANVKDAERRSIELLVDTPNSKTNRKLELVLEANRSPNKELRVSLTSPYKQAVADLVMVDTETELSLTGRLVNDGAEYLVKVGADISGTDNKKTYKPLFETANPHNPDGKSTKKGKKAKQEYSVEGSLTVDKDGASRKFTFNNVILSSSAGKLKINGWVARDQDSVSSDLKVNHGKDDTVTVKGKAQRFSPSHFSVDGEVLASQYPDLGLALKWDYNRAKEQLETNLVLVHGRDLTSTESKVTAHALVKYRWADSKDFEYSGEGNVAYPLLGLDAKVEGSANPKSVHYKLDGSYEKNNVKSELTAKCNTVQPGDYEVQFEAKVLDNSVRFESKRDIVSPTQNKFSNSLELQPGGKYELNADVTCKREESNVLSKIVAEVKIAGQPDAYTLDAGIELNPQELESHAKASVGSVDYLDVSAKLTKGANPAGNFKVLIKGHVDGAGQFKYTNGAGSLALSVDLIKLDRKVKASGDLTVAGSNRVLNLDVFLNADKDPSKKIHISSDSDVKANSIDSKNTVAIFEYKTEFNVKGELTGKLTNGHLVASGDLTLPSDRYLTFNIDRVMHLLPGNSDMLGKIELTSAVKKGDAPASVTVNVRGDKLDIRRAVFDFDFDLVFKNAVGKDVNYHVLAKSLPEEKTHAIEFKGLVKGSLLELAPLIHVKVDVNKPVVEYKVQLNLAADSNLVLVGKCQSNEAGLPNQVENSLELNLPTGELKNIKMTENWTYVRGQSGAPCSLKGFFTATCNNEKTIKVEADMQGTKQEGSGKVSVTLPKDDSPRVIQGSFKVDKSAGYSRELSAKYNHGDKEAHVDVKVEVPESKDSVKVTIKGGSPYEKLRTVEIVFNGARSESLMQSDLTVVTNDKKVVIATKYGRDPKNPIVEVSIVHPGGKSLVGFNFQKKDSLESEYAGEVNLEHGGNALAAKLDARVPSAHDFEIKLDLDSERLKLDKVHIVIANRPAKGGKSVTVQATEAGKQFINGKLDYQFQDGSDGTLYEATGNLKVRGESKAAKISLKRNVITGGDEEGTQIIFVSYLGDRVVEADYKLSNKEFHLNTKLCKDKDQCGHSTYVSTFKMNRETREFRNEVNAGVDVTGLGLKGDVGYHRLTERRPKYFSNKVDVTSKDKSIYKSAIEITDKELSATINTPQREIAAEAKYALTFDASDRRHFNCRLEATAWLDRTNQPAAKSTFLAEHDIVRGDDTVTVTCETRFQNPALGKDLVVKGKTVIGGRSIVDSSVEIDVFAKRGQKIVVDTKIVKNQIANGYNFTAVVEAKSKGQSLDVSFDSHLAASTSVVGIGSTFSYTDKANAKKDLGFGYQATLSKVSLFVKSPTDVLVNIDVSSKMDDHRPSIDALVDIVGLQAIVAEARVDKENKLTYAVYKRDTPDRKVQGMYYVDLTDKAVVQAEWVQGAEKKELYNFVLTWGKEVDPQISYSLDNVKELLEYVRKDFTAYVEKIKSLSTELSTETSTELNDFIEHLKKAQPNLKDVVAAYSEQVKAIRSEIASDQAIQEVSDVVKQLVKTAVESVAHITEIFAKIADRAVDYFERVSNTLLTSLKKIIPAVTDCINKTIQVSVNISNALVNRALVVLQRVVEVIKKHEAEFKQIVTVVAELGRDFARIVGRGLSQAWREVFDFLVILSDQLKALPVFGMVQERVQELKQQLKDYTPPEHVFETFNEIATGIKEALPTEELKEFITAVTAYVEKVLKKQKVDDVAEIKGIYQKLVAAVRSVVVLIRQEVGTKDTQGLAGVSQWPLHLKALFKLPLFASVHFSPLALLRSDDLPTLKQLYYTYRPTLNPLDWIPPYNSYGILIDSSHFFTFDRRHFTFKGTCSYLLAQDAVNGNFSVVLNLEAGKFKSIQVTDGADTVEVIASRQLLFNGKPHEFPLRTAGLASWISYHDINVKTVSGVWVKLDMDHHFATFHVSGFYHGQVRGLLGDLNNEQFDDFRMPNGKVSEDAAEFGNAYQVGGGQCSPGTAVGHEHHGHHEAECTSLFSANSPLRSAFSVVDPTPFREACDHLLTETVDKKQEYACRIAAAYVTAARSQWVLVNVPNVCASCKSGDKTFPVGETVSVKAPNKAADVIFLVEQVTTNSEVYKELVGPLVASLTNELKTKGINDVEISLIGYGHPEVKWPTHFTTDGKMNFDGKAKVDFGDAKKVPTEPSTGAEKWQLLKHKIAVELGLSQLTGAMIEASKYPYRVGASKTIILVTSSNCEKSALPFGLQKLRLFLGQKEIRDRGISFHVVSSLEDFNVAGSKDAKQLKSIVGFDKTTVYSLSDAKKKVLEGNDNLRPDLEYKQDVCVEAAQTGNGAAFNAHNFIESKAGARKQFLQVLSKRVADSLTAEYTEDCRCSLVHGVHTATRCKVTGRKEAEPVAAKGKKANKN